MNNEKRQNETRQDDTRQDNGRDARLEAALRAALQREHAPAGFAERLEARIATEGRSFRRNPLSLGWPARVYRGQARLAIAAALLLAILLPVGWGIHQRAQAARGEAAKQEVMLALRITGTHLRSIQQHTHTINAGLPEGDSQ